MSSYFDGELSTVLFLFRSFHTGDRFVISVVLPQIIGTRPRMRRLEN